ncbi:MAG: GspE/PulE family protein [Cellulosilyticaceae bacterium]
MSILNKKRTGDLLVETGLITPEDLKEVLQVQKKTGQRIGEIIVEKGLLTENEILEVLSFQLGIPQVDLTGYIVDPTIANIVPESVAKKYVLIAIGRDNTNLRVVFSDPANILAMEDLQITTHMNIIPFIAIAKDIQAAIGKVYASSKASDIVSQVESELKAKAYKDMAEREVLATSDNAPVVQLVNNIIEQAIGRNASDIHIQPCENFAKVRFRIDGQLMDIMTLPKESINPVTTRIKIMANLDISERRLPQDGRITRQLGKEELDLRISILPSILGEKTVIRLIYRTGLRFAMEELGFHPLDYGKIKDLLCNPNGIILVTGPTGSGKSTTLSSLLSYLNKPNVNIITVEDPVETMLDNITQVAVNTKAGLGFAQALRSILRQDPDIIMVGEIRDNETSSIAVRAAITGHLVLSTLHTNDATSSIMRLIDMGTEAYMVSSAVKGAVAQRLARRICRKCKKEHLVTEEEEILYKIRTGTKVYQGTGCAFCNNTGYKGRIGIHEIFIPDIEMQDQIATGKLTSEQLRRMAVQKGMRTLWDNAQYNVLQGNITMEEMLRITYHE